MKTTLKINNLFAALVALGLLAGCEGTDTKIELTSVQPTSEQALETRGSVVMDFATSNIPFPHDALFSGSTDGTLNIPVVNAKDVSDPIVAMNALDGFSTTAPITFKLSKALDTTDANNNTIADVFETGLKVYKTTASATTKAVTGISATLTPGVDYFPKALDSQTVALVPLKPLEPKTTYLVVVTDNLKDKDGNAMQAGVIYNNLKGSTALSGTLKDLEPLRQLTNAQVAVVTPQLTANETPIASWTFSTQSTSDVFGKLTSTAISNASLAVTNSNKTTTDFGGKGAAKIYVGSIKLPYYSKPYIKDDANYGNPSAAITSHWQGQTGGELTQFSIAQGDSPKQVIEQTVAVLMSVPPSCETKGADAPCAVTIFQHGITGNRSHLLAVADTLASIKRIGVAIDLPLHGITDYDTAKALRDAAIGERTFDLDLVTQNASGSTTAAAADNIQDSSGTHFVNLQSLVSTRDNLRQAVSDLLQLKAALSNISGISLNANKVSFIGHSLGAAVGQVFANYASDLESVVLVTPGQQLAYVFANSATFGPVVQAGLNAKGISATSADYQQFLLAAQTAIESGDPVNYSTLTIPTLVIEVADDQVIPNSSASAPLMGSSPEIKLLGLTPLKNSGAVTSSKGYLRFSKGHHSSLLRAASVSGSTATPDETLVQETMQEAMASFIASGGTAISVTSNSTIAQ